MKKFCKTASENISSYRNKISGTSLKKVFEKCVAVTLFCFCFAACKDDEGGNPSDPPIEYERQCDRNTEYVEDLPFMNVIVMSEDYIPSTPITADTFIYFSLATEKERGVFPYLRIRVPVEGYPQDQKEEHTYEICNFPDDVKEKIYSLGIASLTISGKVFEPSWKRGIAPTDRVRKSYDLELIYIELEED